MPFDRGVPSRHAVLAGAIAALAGLVVFLVAVRVFPYHSSNHDEAVYLTQAAMLLEGAVWIDAGPLAEAVHPWFFIEDDGRLYAKYSPAVPALYAAAIGLSGEPRIALAAVAVAIVWFTYVLASAAFDRTIGVVAAAAVLCAPLFVTTTATFLPYAPTTASNLAFAVAYVIAYRRDSLGWALLSGTAIGVAFFARPYTAVLFAAPFVLHASASALRAGLPALLEGEVRASLRPPAVRLALATAIAGSAWVGITLGYNALVTGDALLFPYQAFAPQDGIGFGHRRILGHEAAYTPTVALEANGYVLWYYLTRWAPLGPIGGALAVVGVGAIVRSRLTSPSAGFDPTTGLDDRTLRWLLLGVIASVVIGNVAFWGNYNILATFGDPTDGLISQFGPFYHFDLLAPTAVYAAVTAVTAARRVDRRVGRSPTSRRRIVLAGLVLLVVVPSAAVGYAAIDEPIDRNAAYTEKYDVAYEPVESRTSELSEAVVFVPTPYGEWLNHPFQVLRPDPTLEGEPAYVLDRSPTENFAVIDAYGDRQPYRYTYRGEWTPNADRHVVPLLERLAVETAPTFRARTVVGVPDAATGGTVRVEADGEARTYAIESLPTDSFVLEWLLTDAGVSVHEDGLESIDETGPIPIEGAQEVRVSITLRQPDGSTLTYVQVTAIERQNSRYRVIWPAERSVCRLTTDCGRSGRYLPDRPDQHVDGVAFDIELAATGRARFQPIHRGEFPVDLSGRALRGQR